MVFFYEIGRKIGFFLDLDIAAKWRIETPALSWVDVISFGVLTVYMSGSLLYHFAHISLFWELNCVQLSETAHS